MTKTFTLSLAFVLATLTSVSCATRQENAAVSAPAQAPRQTPTQATTNAQRASLPPTQGKLAKADRKAWREVVGWSDDCEDAFEATAGGAGDDAGLEFFELGEGRRLVKVLCAGGAYQPSQVFAVVDEGGAKPPAKVLTFDIYESPDDNELEKTSAQEVWGLADFDARTKRLRVHNRFRGPGDCGTLATYAFDGAAPALKELRADLRCDGKGAENPEQWEKVSPGR